IQGDSLNKPGKGAATFNFSGLTDAQSRRFTVIWRAETSAPHYLYLDMKGHDLDSLTLTADGHDIPVDGKRKGILELGQIPEGGTLSLSVVLAEGAPASGSFEARLASMDKDLLAALSAQAQAATLTDLVYQDGLLTGSLEADKAGYLLISMPFDPGWKAYIDGQEVTIKTLDQALMAIPVKEGHQAVFLTFLPQGFNEGLLVSSAALGLLILILLGRGLFILYQKKKAGEDLSFALAFQSIKQKTFFGKRKVKNGDMDLIEGDEEGKGPL
ncbi:MAG TPA: YfhO family protein, partial [Clostridia bacterium]|nr:YfhO family protein [Clostridia bacterium]